MRDSLLIQILVCCLGFLFLVYPTALYAYEIDSSIQEIEPTEIFEPPNQMTQNQMNELFGEDPYLGQTSYLQSPDGFSQRDKSK